MIYFVEIQNKILWLWSKRNFLKIDLHLNNTDLFLIQTKHSGSVFSPSRASTKWFNHVSVLSLVLKGGGI